MPEKITVKTRTEVKWKDKIVYRDYPVMTNKELIEKLYHYDTDKPTLDGKMVTDTTFRANAGLYDRKWERDFELECHKEGNWKMTVGVSVGAFILGGILGGVTGWKMRDIGGGR